MCKKNNDDTARIDFIRKQFASINHHLNAYKKIEKEDTAQTTEGNQVIEYFNGKELKKITAEYFGEMGKELDEYYFFNKKLIFYYSRYTKYKQPFYLTKNPLIDSVKETRYYFNGDKIFRIKLNPKEDVPPEKFNELSVATQKEAARLSNVPDAGDVDEGD